MASLCEVNVLNVCSRQQRRMRNSSPIVYCISACSKWTLVVLIHGAVSRAKLEFPHILYDVGKSVCSERMDPYPALVDRRYARKKSSTVVYIVNAYKYHGSFVFATLRVVRCFEP